MTKNYHHFSEIKHRILSKYPTTIRRSVCLPHVISIDHSVNRWLYERWLKNYSVESELNSLHQEMVQQVEEQLDISGVRVEIVHLDPRTSKYAGASD
jgi:hypothetical protein